MPALDAGCAESASVLQFSDRLGIVCLVALAWEAEDEEDLKLDAGLILKSFLGAFPERREATRLSRTFDFDKLRHDTASLQPTDNLMLHLVKDLKTWAGSE